MYIGLHKDPNTVLKQKLQLQLISDMEAGWTIWTVTSFGLVNSQSPYVVPRGFNIREIKVRALGDLGVVSGPPTYTSLLVQEDKQEWSLGDVWQSPESLLKSSTFTVLSTAIYSYTLQKKPNNKTLNALFSVIHFQDEKRFFWWCLKVIFGLSPR